MDRAVSLGIAAAAAAALVRRHVARAAMVRVGNAADFQAAGAGLEYAVIPFGARWRADDVLVVRRVADGRLWAICNTCPHAGYPLHEGDIEDLSGTCADAAPLDAPIVSCPAHAYVFDMARGTCLSGGSAARCPPAPAYGAQMRGGELFLTREPLTGGGVGTAVLNAEQSNAVVLEMVRVALDKKYGRGGRGLKWPLAQCGAR
ncbi:hypothetical protein KFE25_004963 [Diacronema lutheri]|uniref:Rieske domain-containing protein n=1 Tax=Diacronema lutheri TaxID=2081491 RepID=A0A8J5XGG3_DIALT|nr:hypothetical protein KFE25_004963 [Diacronema lutheri]